MASQRRAPTGRHHDALGTFGARADVRRRHFLPFPKASASESGGRFIFHFTEFMRRIMDPWFETEIRTRRADAFADRYRRAVKRLAESGRSTGMRVRLANGAQALSDALATVARTLRANETV
jgi:hypothetical protein